jgi:hypothetical protein
MWYLTVIDMVYLESYFSIILTVIVAVTCLPLLSQHLSTVTMAQIQTGNSSPINKIPLSIKLPLSKGYVNGNILYFLATDASDNKTATSITKSTGFKVNFAPALALVPISARGQGYDFLNGVKGDGSFGFQTPVANAMPGEKGYSPLVQLNFVKWNPTAKPRVLNSVAEIINAEKNGQITIINTNIVINSPVAK